MTSTARSGTTFSAIVLPLQESAGGKPSCGGNGCRSLQPQLLDALVAHDKFLDLAGHGGGEGLDELDVARDFVMGDFSATILSQLLGTGRLPLTQSHPGHDLLAILRIGHADYLYIADLRMRI